MDFAPIERSLPTAAAVQRVAQYPFMASDGHLDNPRLASKGAARTGFLLQEYNSRW
jgi:hypothetical protein